MTSTLEAVKVGQECKGDVLPEQLYHQLKMAGYDTPASMEMLIQQAEAMKPYARVSVRVPLASLAKIVEDGRLKAVDETRTSNGLTAGADRNLHRLEEYVKIRKEFETDKLDWREGKPRIVYGFLGYSDELGDINLQAPTYGRVQLVLKPEVADRSTFTSGDSLMRAFDDYPLELLEQDDAVILQQALEHSRQQPINPLQGIHYVEAQIRGGVMLDDLESICVTIKPTSLPEISNVLKELHDRVPQCKLIVNIDYTTSQGVPLELIRSLPFVEFRPIVIHRNNVFVERKTVGYANDDGGNTVESEYQASQERLRNLGNRFMELLENGYAPDNLKHPTASFFRNGDRFPPNS